MAEMQQSIAVLAEAESSLRQRSTTLQVTYLGAVYLCNEVCLMF